MLIFLTRYSFSIKALQIRFNNQVTVLTKNPDKKLRSILVILFSEFVFKK
jgi:hypothetical protein